MIQNFEQRYRTARRAVIARRYARMNPQQREAVLTTQGPLLLLAGAGSGKTTVLINRVDNLLNFGQGSDSTFVPEWATEEDLAFLEQFPQQPSPEDWREARRLCAVEPAASWSVIAITFTNKAAGELKERLERISGRRLSTVPVFVSCAAIWSGWAQALTAILPSTTAMTASVSLRIF